jgi:hypothetical protein
VRVRVAAGVRDGRIELDLGRGLFYVLSVQAKLVELAQTADLERRIAALEASSMHRRRVKRWPA